MMTKNITYRKSGILQIGITGHRNLCETSSERLIEQICKVLNAIKKQTQEIYLKQNSNTSEEDLEYKMLSPLAEGADRLAAKAALICGYKLDCPLPLSIEEYEKDFLTEESKFEFRELLSNASTVFEIKNSRTMFEGGEAYLNVGQYILDRCDILISVWDGRETHKKGGTYDITRRAIAKNMPIIWINSENCISKFLIDDNTFSDWEEELKKRMRLLMPNRKGKNQFKNQDNLIISAEKNA